jgi:hypothetical protein
MSFSAWRGGLRGARLWDAVRLQWAPTLTAHDPNPPINLETPTAGGISGSLSTAFDAMTVAGTGAVAVRGALGVTFDAMGLAGAGAVRIAGGLSATLDGMTLAGSGTVAGGGGGPQVMIFFGGD